VAGAQVPHELARRVERVLEEGADQARLLALLLERHGDAPQLRAVGDAVQALDRELDAREPRAAFLAHLRQARRDDAGELLAEDLGEVAAHADLDRAREDVARARRHQVVAARREQCAHAVGRERPALPDRYLARRKQREHVEVAVEPRDPFLVGLLVRVAARPGALVGHPQVVDRAMRQRAREDGVLLASDGPVGRPDAQLASASHVGERAAQARRTAVRRLQHLVLDRHLVPARDRAGDALGAEGAAVDRLAHRLHGELVG
jgi:hypothetical protein